MNYESHKTIASTSNPGVTFKLRRMSVERRLGLTRRLRELLQRVEFLESGEDPRESMEAALLATEINQVYLLVRNSRRKSITFITRHVNYAPARDYACVHIDRIRGILYSNHIVLAKN